MMTSAEQIELLRKAAVYEAAARERADLELARFAGELRVLAAAIRGGDRAGGLPWRRIDA
jgi:hypothetical protein